MANEKESTALIDHKQSSFKCEAGLFTPKGKVVASLISAVPSFTAAIATTAEGLKDNSLALMAFGIGFMGLTIFLLAYALYNRFLNQDYHKNDNLINDKPRCCC